MTNNEKFNELLNAASNPRRIFELLPLFLAQKTNKGGRTIESH